MKLDLLNYWKSGKIGGDFVLELFSVYYNPKLNLFSILVFNFGIRMWFKLG